MLDLHRMPDSSGLQHNPILYMVQICVSGSRSLNDQVTSRPAGQSVTCAQHLAMKHLRLGASRRLLLSSKAPSAWEQHQVSLPGTLATGTLASQKRLGKASVNKVHRPLQRPSHMAALASQQCPETAFVGTFQYPLQRPSHLGGSASTSAHCTLVRLSRILSRISFFRILMAARPLPT